MKRGKKIFKKQVMRKVLNEFINKRETQLVAGEKELRKTIKEMKLTLSILGNGLSNLVKW